MQVNPLPAFERSAAVYDIIHASKDYDGELSRIILHLEPARGLFLPRVIDWGCGTGGFTRCLARRGWDALGIDENGEMVRLAGAKGVRAIRGSIHGVAPVATTEAATCLFGAFSYMATDATKLQHALQTVRGRLIRRGRFVFDVINLSGAVLGLKRHSEDVFESDGQKVVRQMRKTLNPESCVVEHRIHYQWTHGDVTEDWHEYHYMRAFSVAELKYALRHCGFKMVCAFTNEGDPLATEIPSHAYYFTVVAEAE